MFGDSLSTNLSYLSTFQYVSTFDKDTWLVKKVIQEYCLITILDKSAFTLIMLFCARRYTCKMIILLIENQDTTEYVVIVIIVTSNTRANLINKILIKSHSPSYLKIDHTHNTTVVLIEVHNISSIHYKFVIPGCILWTENWNQLYHSFHVLSRIKTRLSDSKHRK